MIHNRSKIQLKSRKENNFMVGGHHNVRNCIERSHHLEGGEASFQGLESEEAENYRVENCMAIFQKQILKNLMGYLTI